MLRRLPLTVLFFLIVNLTGAQEKPNVAKINAYADSYYREKNYDKAAQNYLEVIEHAEFRGRKKNAAYNAACCLALLHKKDSAFIMLNDALKYGYNNKKHLSRDSDLTVLHGSEKWKEFLDKMPEAKSLNSEPEKAVIHTSDIHHFWEAYDLANQDTANARDIYQTYYFDKGTDGMHDYMGLKVSSVDHFVKHIQFYPKLYSTLRENTLKVDAYKVQIMESFKHLKAIYPQAKFPDVYFLIGAFTSGGTISSSGLLIGTNQMSDGEGVNKEELDFGMKLLMNESAYIPNIVAHELIHFQQDGMKRESITLRDVIKEGMADFIGELISGGTANEKIFEWARGKEKQIWAKFQKDMYLNRYSNWIANYNTASKDSYPDLGYWIGYEICKSYYENANDKKQAIYDMLHIQDYKKFLADSRWESKLEQMY
ncbi:TPR end-of-group domain-containing protein [Lutimonas zeaxanthinifaciens]|uniref:gliding motility protein GldB-related protein n=1 Tax=Lutimonas zeaxanthinifaciens TaxID=3060215 RepID=UPI00265CAB46|nr:DUF2268 domain-containing putative Zn-dependent protease [Lutimonas sp. YSD2104]WKK67491.1 DUF2268 domain-containing putative Zn-dependent protease [Lutimonas sp. YSD2104]